MNRRRRIPSLEALERREAPVGFYQGPPLEALPLALNGSLSGTAVTNTHAAITTIRVNAQGPVRPLFGRSQLSGRLQIVGGSETGVFTLNSPRSQMTLLVSGPVGGALRFHIANGMGTQPGTTFDFVREVGAGSFSLSLSSGTGPLSAGVTLRS